MQKWRFGALKSGLISVAAVAICENLRAVGA
jgi:hypothetical protein